MIKKRKRLSPETVQGKSLAIAARFFELEEFQNSRNLLFYLSLASEVQTDRMIRRSLDLGKRVCVPILAPGKRLEVSEIRTLDLEFAVRALGVREPRAEDRIPADAGDLDLIVVPGLAFDTHGARIGYGGGYFDRFLADACERARRVALAFDFQILPSVPQTEQDVPVHRILTETTTINC